MSGEKVYKRFAGGSVRTAEEGGKFLVILNEVVLFDLADEEDRGKMKPVRTYEFETEAERSAYLLERFGPPGPDTFSSRRGG